MKFTIRRISNEAIPCPPPRKFHKVDGISNILRIIETAWIISGPRLV